jgi:hypothetical protein
MASMVTFNSYTVVTVGDTAIFSPLRTDPIPWSITAVPASKRGTRYVVAPELIV